MLEIMPILKVLWRGKLGPILIILQLSLTLALVSNALFFIQQRLENINRPTGIGENTFAITMLPISDDADLHSFIQEDLATIRALPGVEAVTITNQTPLSGSGSSTMVLLDPDADAVAANAMFYMVDEQATQAFGNVISEGRDFTAEDTTVNRPGEFNLPSVIIITKKLANELFPGESAIGKRVYITPDSALEIIGVIERNLGSWPNNKEIAGNVMLIPTTFLGMGRATYVINTEPEELDKLMLTVPEKLNANNSDRVIEDAKKLMQMKRNRYRGDNAMIKILSLVLGLLTFVNALGIIGLSSFLVNQRRKQIGTRRALGATKFAILRYFLLENGLICTVAIIIGAAFSLVINDLLVREYSLAVLPWHYIPIAALTVFIITFVAAYFPAKRATGFSPAYATRNI